MVFSCKDSDTQNDLHWERRRPAQTGAPDRATLPGSAAEGGSDGDDDASDADDQNRNDAEADTKTMIDPTAESDEGEVPAAGVGTAARGSAMASRTRFATLVRAASSATRAATSASDDEDAELRFQVVLLDGDRVIVKASRGDPVSDIKARLNELGRLPTGPLGAECHVMLRGVVLSDETSCGEQGLSDGCVLYLHQVVGAHWGKKRRPRKRKRR